MAENWLLVPLASPQLWNFKKDKFLMGLGTRNSDGSIPKSDNWIDLQINLITRKQFIIYTYIFAMPHIFLMPFCVS